MHSNLFHKSWEFNASPDGVSRHSGTGLRFSSKITPQFLLDGQSSQPKGKKTCTNLTISNTYTPQHLNSISCIKGSFSYPLCVGLHWLLLLILWSESTISKGYKDPRIFLPRSSSWQDFVRLSTTIYKSTATRYIRCLIFTMLFFTLLDSLKHSNLFHKSWDLK